MSNRFIRINGQDFSFDSVAAALGIPPPEGSASHQIQLCQRVHDGILVAGGSDYDSDPYPHMDVELQLPQDKDTLPIFLTRSEQPEYSGEVESLRTFCYSREEEYFAFFDADTRSDADVERDPLPPSMVVSGSPLSSVSVKAENPYVSFEHFVFNRPKSPARLSHDEAQRLATEINDFQRLYDTYEYSDRVSDPSVHIDAICTALLSGRTDFMFDYFKEFSQESRDPDIVSAAKALLSRLQAFVYGRSDVPDKSSLDTQIADASFRTVNTSSGGEKSIPHEPGI